MGEWELGIGNGELGIGNGGIYWDLPQCFQLDLLALSYYTFKGAYVNSQDKSLNRRFI
jgi:hypothetical protein